MQSAPGTSYRQVGGCRPETALEAALDHLSGVT